MSHHFTFSILSAFAIGSIPFGWIIAKLWGVGDLRQVGSSNIGATNVVRTAGWTPGALTFLLDYLKGILPMLYFSNDGADTSIWIGVAAVVGHCYSPLLKFNGGKGVSTTLGVVTALNPFLGAASIFVYGITLGLLRVSALGSLFAMLVALAGTVLFAPVNSAKLAVLIMVLIVLTRHRENWNKLLSATASILLILFCSMNARESWAGETIDFRGKSIISGLNPKRVVALLPSLAEIAVDLGEGARLVGVPEYTKLPPSIRKNVKTVGPYNQISPEAVYSLHPDLVLASLDGSDAGVVKTLEKLGIRVTTVNTQSLVDIVRSMKIVAAALGQRSNKKISDFENEININEIKPSAMKRIFVQIGWDPLVTVSGSTFIDDLVKVAGGINIFDKSSIKYPRPNPEEVISKNPDVIVICRLTPDGSEADRAMAFWKKFTSLKAVKNDRVVIFPPDYLTKPGFALFDGLQALKKVL